MAWHASPGEPRPRRYLWGRSAVVAPIVLVLAAVSLVATGCGGGSSASSVARIGKTTATSVAGAGAAGTTPANPADVAKHYEQALKFSECMRSHGVADFPDPNASGGIQISGSGAGGDLNPNSPTFSAAQSACQKYFPAGNPSPQQQADAQAHALAFAACMRKNGVPNYPDPQFLSGGRVIEKVGPGVDPGSPTFQAAQQKCVNSSFGGAVASPAG